MAIPEKYRDIVSRSSKWAAGIGVPGALFPPLDIAAMTIVWTKMTRDIAKRANHPINWFLAAKLIYSITAGSLLYIGGSETY